MPYWMPNALLEQLARRSVRLFGGAFRPAPACLARPDRDRLSIGRHHSRIAREGCGDPEFLLFPIDVGDAIARRRLDQPTQPHARPEDELGVARLVAPGAGRNADSKQRLRPSLPTAKSLSRILRKEKRNSRNGDTSGWAAPSVGKSRRIDPASRNPVGAMEYRPGQPINKQIVLERAAFKYAVVLIDIRNEGELDTVPVAAQTLEGLDVDGHAVAFNSGGGGHVSTAQ